MLDHQRPTSTVMKDKGAHSLKFIAEMRSNVFVICIRTMGSKAVCNVGTYDWKNIHSYHACRKKKAALERVGVKSCNFKRSLTLKLPISVVPISSRADSKTRRIGILSMWFLSHSTCQRKFKLAIFYLKPALGVNPELTSGKITVYGKPRNYAARIKSSRCRWTALCTVWDLILFVPFPYLLRVLSSKSHRYEQSRADWVLRMMWFHELS